MTEQTQPTASKEASMALSEDQIIDLFNEACREAFNGLERFRYFARAVEAEVQKQDDALIRQMLEALEKVDQAMPFPVARQEITAARARLGDK